jgi:methyl-accepting chemotaxis protein
MDGALQLVGGGVARADEADHAIQRIGASVGETTTMVADIASAIQEQGQASHSMAAQIERISRMAEEASAAAAQAASFADGLAQRAGRQLAIISQYQV